MACAIIFDKNITKASTIAVKSTSICETSLNLTDALIKSSLNLEVPTSSCLLVTGSLETLKAGKKANMICCYIGQESLINQILCGADMSFESFLEFPKFSTLEEFEKLCEETRRSFYKKTIIGKMLDGAISIMENSYSPYSKFPVGAVIRTERGNYYSGCNVENASFGGTICAERGAAMASIASEGKTTFNMIAIASDAPEPAPPCAICRQFLSEFTPPDAQVFLISRKTNVIRHYNFGTIMPYTFTEF